MNEGTRVGWPVHVYECPACGLKLIFPFNWSLLVLRDDAGNRVDLGAICPACLAKYLSQNVPTMTCREIRE